ncbi:MAG TPA: GNAT family N-acetyltransferase [Dongiaceae bacterium]|jgi:ribosomal protein S18 acetylase RimI-like enzyme|nr:GNAT family N-acetyltransferase [Dongiaceae bacterium]
MLPDSRLSLFGRSYLASSYRYFACSPHELAFVARDGDQILGGGFVSLAPDSLSRRLLTHTPLLCHLALRPIGRGARQLAADLLAPAAAPAASDEPELVAIFVASESRGRGIGEAICREVERELGRRQIKSYRVRTERDPANRAIAFYRRLGFIESGAEARGRFLVLSKSLP